MIKSKSSSQILKPLTNFKEKEMAKPIYVSALSSPIPEKSPKEVNEISKYFKKNTN